MKEKHKIIKTILIILFLVLIGFNSFDKSFQNDTFFTIKLGNSILQNGIQTSEQLTYHSDFKFYNVRWLFDIIIATIFNAFHFNGILFFTFIFTFIICLLMYSIIYKNTNNVILSILLVFTSLTVIKYSLTCRAQIVSTTLFIIQYISTIGLLKTNKKKYCFALLVIPILLVNIHGSVFPLLFIFYLPFIANYFISKSNKLSDTFKRLESDNFIYYKQLFIIIIINFFEGLINPFLAFPYYMMFSTSSNYSSTIIVEMQPVPYKYIPLILLYFELLFLPNQKQKIHKAFMLLGLCIMTFLVLRSQMYLFTIGTIIISNSLNILIIEKKDKIIQKISAFKYFPTLLITILLLININIFIQSPKELYLDSSFYPISATEFLKNNLDLNKEILYNSFNTGSYLEFNGIKTFMDSRAELFEKPFNDTDIIKDFKDYIIDPKQKDYKTFMEKYNFTIALIDKNQSIYNKISTDYYNNYSTLYEDDNYIIYRIKPTISN